MSGVSIAFEIKGIPAAVQVLRRRMMRLENFRDPLALVADDFFKIQKGWMDSEGRGSWEELAPGYAKWKRKKVGDKPILQFSGRMYDDLTGRSPGSLRIERGRVTVRAVKSGNLWRYHSRGSADGNKSGNPRPRRQVLSPALRIRKARWGRILRDWVAGVDV
jgi:hypothetical protein